MGPKMTELWKLTATALADMIRSGKTSSREVVQAHLDRIEAVNGKVNAVTVTLAEAALAAAEAADNAEPAGPLHGVPFTIKENIDCVGSATTQGVPAMAEAMPPLDAPCVARMKAAGAIPLARTNLPELGLRIDTDNPLRGRTLNPWNEALTAGGSSGGEGAALATGMTPIGLGNDIGGSLRNPAYCCGITSLKPTTGRIPRAGSLPPIEQPISYRLMAVEGPMARSVADLELALELLSGFDPRDPMSAPAPVEGPSVAKRAGLVTAMPFTGLPDVTMQAVRRAGEALEAHGWQVEEVEPPDLGRVNEIWGHLLASDIEQMLPMLTPLMSDDAIWLLEGLIDTYNPSQLPNVAMHTERDGLMTAWSSVFVDYPVLIGPTWADLPFEHGADIDRDSGVETTLNRLQFITPGNLLGIPAVALPMGVAEGLPTGIQIYADRWREDVCLDVASLIESEVGGITPIDPV